MVSALFRVGLTYYAMMKYIIIRKSNSWLIDFFQNGERISSLIFVSLLLVQYQVTLTIKPSPLHFLYIF